MIGSLSRANPECPMKFTVSSTESQEINKPVRSHRERWVVGVLGVNTCNSLICIDETILAKWLISLGPPSVMTSVAILENWPVQVYPNHLFVFGRPLFSRILITMVNSQDTVTYGCQSKPQQQVCKIKSLIFEFCYCKPRFRQSPSLSTLSESVNTG